MGVFAKSGIPRGAAIAIKTRVYQRLYNVAAAATWGQRRIKVEEGGEKAMYAYMEHVSDGWHKCGPLGR